MSNAASLKDLVKTGIEQSNPNVVNGVVDHLVGEEVERRKKLILKGLSEVDKLQKEVVKIRPEKRFDIAGTVVSETYAPKDIQERKKVLDRVQKIEGAIEKAIGGDFNPLSNLFQSGGPPKEGEASDQE